MFCCIIVFSISEPSISVSEPIETCGPILELFIITLSPIKHGSLISELLIFADFEMLEPLFVKTLLFVFTAACLFPQSSHSSPPGQALGQANPTT